MKMEILKRIDKAAFFKEHIPSLRINGKPDALGLCPFHGDENPSLSVNIESGFYHCFACGASGDLFTFYQKYKSVNFPTALRELGDMVGIVGSGKPQVVASFKYIDKDGNLLYTKERVEPGRNGKSKEFFFKHSGGKGRGCDPVPYHLPELAKSKYAFVVEGEGKADLLNSWSLTATCLDSGANSPWRDGYLKAFEGKEKVVILPDNDTPGRDYASKIANALHGSVGDLRVVELPGLQEKWDVLDWAAIPGNDKSKLLGIVKETPEWNPTEATKGGKSDKKGSSQSEKLTEIARGYKLFHDDTKEGFAFIDNDAVKVRGSMFKQFLAKKLWELENKSPNSDALNQALNVVEAMAIYDGECIKLSNRVAEHNGCFYYDLADGRAVRITKDGWDVIDNFPILFKRYSHQQRQVEPKKGGNTLRLFDFVNIPDEQHRLLSLVYVISCFIPNIPHPIIHPYGDQGAGKTTFFTFFKLLIDPSKMSVIITPRSMEETVQVLEQHYLCMFDNLSTFPDWLSDLLSQACTGGGFQKRRLYTDDESVIYEIQRCIGLNGINLLISRADLMDRTILLQLERIEPSKRKEWRALMQEFEEERPYILGCFFDVLSKAMALYPSTKVDNLPRMADFMRWGVAIARALGYKKEDFVQAYQGNIESQNAEIINSNTLAQAVLTFMLEQEGWSGTVKECYEKLGELVVISKDDRTFPKHFNKLRSHLNRIKANLLDYGIKFSIEDYSRTKKGVPISFQKVPKVSTPSTPCSPVNKDKAFTGEDPVNIQKVVTL